MESKKGIMMSRYMTIKTQFKDKDALVAALMETGNWTEGQIEINDKPQHLFGFQGDKRKDKATVIIRRTHVGRNANDIGFIQNADGQYEAIISQFDSGKYGKSWIGQLRGNYVFHKLRRDQESSGRTVERTRCSSTGRQRVTITGYR